VQEGIAADGSDLAVAEKPADGHVAEVLPEDTRVEVGAPVETLSAPEAGEEESAGERLGGGLLVALQHGVEVFCGGIGVAEVEANARPLLQVFPDGKDAVARVRTDEVPDQEVPHARLLAEFVHQYAEEECCVGEVSVALVEGGEELLQGLEGWTAV
jgi:hypothetical protein